MILIVIRVSCVQRFYVFNALLFMLSFPNLWPVKFHLTRDSPRRKLSRKQVLKQTYYLAHSPYVYFTVRFYNQYIMVTQWIMEMVVSTNISPVSTVIYVLIKRVTVMCATGVHSRSCPGLCSWQTLPGFI